MTPETANIVGNVHGGNILKMIEEAGAIVAMEHCNDVPERVNFESIFLKLNISETRTQFATKSIMQIHAHSSTSHSKLFSALQFQYL